VDAKTAPVDAPADMPTLAEAGRLMTVCNSCRYCEGLCAVFPAMEMRRTFAPGDLRYLANLCHGCGACFDDCQFAPPHEFDVNVPKVLAELRGDSYAHYAWPRAASGLFSAHALASAIAVALSAAAFVLGFATIAAYVDAGTLWTPRSGPGAFYALMPHGAMAALFSAAFAFAILAMVMGARHFSRDTGEPLAAIAQARSLLQAMKDASSLRYLDGGGDGCLNGTERGRDHRKLYHHLTFYGFGLCFAATCVATLYHYAFGREAPYPWYDLPVLLGTAGGIGLLVGPAGLLHSKWQRDPAMADSARLGMEIAFIALLFLTSFTGLALLVLRNTAAMETLLALHLGVVLVLFITLPYGKFVHGLYRFLALMRYAAERRKPAEPAAP
jgi:citrate/tricarballylate utilization protein